MSPVEVLRHPDPEALAESAAARLITTVVEAQASAGWASLCLTGGRIGTAVLASLAENPGCDAIDWSRIDLWWGDERYLPTGDRERNETGARIALIDRVGIDPSHVHPMPDPAGSVRREKLTSPDVTATVDPERDPPGTYEASYGLMGTP